MAIDAESENIQKFIGDGHCLIVEPSPAFSSSLQACLKDLGILPSQVTVCRKFEDAKKVIAEKKPRLLITEYEIDKSLGLSLIEMLEQYQPESSRLSIIVTKNNSDSAVAEAAEEQVDLFIIKPFSVDTFRKKMGSAIQRKVSPSDYIKKIHKGKKHLEVKEFSDAIGEFLEAKPLDAKPTMAYFYAGQTYKTQGEKALALVEFQAGRKFQPLNYRCLLGEFELLVEERRYKEAYDLVPLIRDNFPITSHRLGQIFIAAVFTSSFDDLPRYYDMFLTLEQRPPQLIKLTSIALLTAGRFAIKKNELAKACQYFEMGTMATGRDFQYIDLVITELLKVKAGAEAQAFLARLSQGEIGEKRYNQLAYQIDEATLPKEQLVEKARKIVTAGHGNEAIYKSIVRLMAEFGKTTLAESAINAAVAQYPDLRATLYEILETSTAKK